MHVERLENAPVPGARGGVEDVGAVGHACAQRGWRVVREQRGDGLSPRALDGGVQRRLAAPCAGAWRRACGKEQAHAARVARRRGC